MEKYKHLKEHIEECDKEQYDYFCANGSDVVTTKFIIDWDKCKAISADLNSLLKEWYEKHSKSKNELLELLDRRKYQIKYARNDKEFNLMQDEIDSLEREINFASQKQ
jgi:hypothetical protein